MPDPDAALTVATDAYFWKPPLSYFRCFELRAYQTAEARLGSPALDLGCGDAEFGAMLSGLLGGSPDLVGADCAMAGLRRGRTKLAGPYVGLLCANAASLPFPDGIFRTVILNGVLGSLLGDIPGSLGEVRRVLAEDGELLCTVPTPRWAPGYWIARTLRAAGMRELARRYTGAMDRRCGNFQPLAPDVWLETVRGAGFTVSRTVGFCSTAMVTCWSFLSWTPLRVHSGLRMLEPLGLRRAVARFYRRLYAGTYASLREIPLEESAFFLIRARKDGP